jgi:alpha-L-fucosidase
VDDLVDIVSKNGSLLLNIGPRPDGTIPEPEEAMLREIGAWLAVNGEAIYGTRPFRVFGEGPTAVVEGPFGDTKRKPFTAEDVRFTTGGGKLYAIVLDWPASGRVTIRSLPTSAPGGDVVSVDLLGAKQAVRYNQDASGLHVELPSNAPSPHAFALRIARRSR